MSDTSLEGTTKLATLAALGLLMSYGSYHLTKKMLTDGQNEDLKKKKARKDLKKQDSTLLGQQIHEQIKQQLGTLNDDFVQKHSQRLRELVAQRQE